MFGKIELENPKRRGMAASKYIIVPQKGARLYELREGNNSHAVWTSLIEVRFDDLGRFNPVVITSERKTMREKSIERVFTSFHFPELPLNEPREVNGKTSGTGAFNKWRCSFTRITWWRFFLSKIGFA